MSITWVLILFAHVGPGGSGNSNALTNVPGFATQRECTSAGQVAAHLSDGTTKEVRFVCAPQTRVP